MKPPLFQLLVDPDEHQLLELDAKSIGEDDDVITGCLRSVNGNNYEIQNSIPRFCVPSDSGQLQTSEAFAFKWEKRNTYDTPKFKALSTEWCLEKYGYNSVQEWSEFFESREAVLDVGCGSGYSSSLWLDSGYWQGGAMWIGVDISAAIDYAKERLFHIENTHFIQADALYLPFKNESFDTIFSEGVFHHTPSTRLALESATRVLAPKGEIQFYIYKRKGPIREFTDDYIRDQISSFSDKEAWDALQSLTELGKTLAGLKAEVSIPNDIPLIGIKAGKVDVQRLIYYNFAKLFWNDDLSFDENVHVNFDWYRPRYAHRQTPNAVMDWCDKAGLNIINLHEDGSGLAIRAVKRK